MLLRHITHRVTTTVMATGTVMTGTIAAIGMVITVVVVVAMDAITTESRTHQIAQAALGSPFLFWPP